jgi:hypothetical protein
LFGNRSFFWKILCSFSNPQARAGGLAPANGWANSGEMQILFRVHHAGALRCPRDNQVLVRIPRLSLASYSGLVECFADRRLPRD